MPSAQHYRHKFPSSSRRHHAMLGEATFGQCHLYCRRTTAVTGWPPEDYDFKIRVIGRAGSRPGSADLLQYDRLSFGNGILAQLEERFKQVFAIDVVKAVIQRLRPNAKFGSVLEGTLWGFR